MKDKRKIRKAFRDSVFARDNFSCKKCGKKPEIAELDAHHITDRNLMPNGGYVTSNGITLCKECHWLAEQFHRTGTAADGFSVEDLYDLIGSSFERAKGDSHV